MSHKNRVVVTGLGVMSPLGESVNEFWDSLISGKSGIGKITLCDTDEFPNDIAGEVTVFDPGQYIDPKEGSIIFIIVFSKVVLPEPFLPFKIVIFPGARDKLIFSKIFLSNLFTDKSLTINIIKV